ncbi:hypothetical protein NQZ79_g3138 [Umbelopsis isabellina]|nr:hypothetical protein NQZ79_g3138 [Umbelopsis isabellina]
MVSSMIPSIEAAKSSKDYNKVFFDAFDFGIFRMRSVDELACKNHKIAFANKIVTDGYAINFLFSGRKASDKEAQNIQLELQDFTASEIIHTFNQSLSTQVEIKYSLPVMVLAKQTINRGEGRFYSYQGRQRAREELTYAYLDGGKKYNARKRKLTRKNRRRRRKKAVSEQVDIPPPTLATGPREPAIRTTANGQGLGPRHWKPAPFQESPKAPLVIFGDAMFGRKNLVQIPGKKNGCCWGVVESTKAQGKTRKLLTISIDEYYTSQSEGSEEGGNSRCNNSPWNCGLQKLSDSMATRYQCWKKYVSYSRSNLEWWSTAKPFARHTRQQHNITATNAVFSVCDS